MRYLLILILVFLTGCGAKQDVLEVFYVPHADDEVLSMGPAIVKAIDESKNIHIILLSEGKASKAIHNINKRLDEEGIDSLNTAEFGQARVQEFKDAVQALGVKESSITILDLPDGKITKEDINELMMRKEKEHHHVIHHVMSDLDPHSDHAATGEALRQLLHDKVVEHGKFYLPIQEHDKLPYQDSAKASSKQERQRVLKALDAYGVWEPENKNYSIGQISVPKYFQTARKSFESKYHH
ncbi:GlcNAc-PI de-N-acetylase [Bacillus sp. THAF10]|uniref:PIG-L deacetylase family protein n=1 Tax=Bacillus sp. THAF10 TaxID=2587848 RepID=UPI001267BF16|nr:PIG-L family deacetylase [Bacillus sp. THAF10]QFT90679.1 GlcNAc-PI de-N-acetylase [Bacillus sp. THAF10]